MSRVLVIEDEPLVARYLETVLAEAGFEVVGVAASLEKGLAMIDDRAFDIAVLDANLRGKSVAPVAHALRDRGTPFLIVTGYDRSFVSEQFPSAPALQKPLRSTELIHAIRVIVNAT